MQFPRVITRDESPQYVREHFQIRLFYLIVEGMRGCRVGANRQKLPASINSITTKIVLSR